MTLNKREVKIFCPGCAWEPRPASRWFCGGCSHHWNTFETAGNCPECGKLHEETQCLSCHARSPHPNWYHDFTFEVEEMVVLQAIGEEI